MSLLRAANRLGTRVLVHRLEGLSVPWKSKTGLGASFISMSDRSNKGRSGAVDRASDFGPRGPWFDSPPVHISL